MSMTVLPIPSIPSALAKYTGLTPPAGLVALNKPRYILPPAGQDGPGLPSSEITPYSGIYDQNGKLPTPPSNLLFLA